MIRSHNLIFCNARVITDSKASRSGLAVFLPLILLSGCAKPKQATASHAVAPVTQTPVSTAARLQPVDQPPVYVQMRPYPYNRRTPPAASQQVFEGLAPATQEEFEQAVAANPDSNMAKAQEFYTNANGQKNVALYGNNTC